MRLAERCIVMCSSAALARVLPPTEPPRPAPVRAYLSVCPPLPERAAPPLDVTREIVDMGPALRRRAQRLTRSAAEAEDLAQETVLRALDAAPEFASREHLRAWLYTVLRNAFVSRRRRDRNAERAAAELTVMIEQRGPAPGPRFLTKSVERALEALPEPFARVVQLVDLEDNTYADASAALGVPIGTIMSRLFRGRQRLARALAARDDLAR